MNTQTQPFTEQQQAVVTALRKTFEIDDDEIRFLNPEKPQEPWLSSGALMSIARQTGAFQTISERYDKYIEALNQVVHVATVIDKEGRSFERTGVATVGENLSLTGAREIDAHALAGARALNAALRAAGFHPLRAGSVINLDLNLPKSGAVDNAAQRDIDLGHIHAVAEEKGLIRKQAGGKKDVSLYKTFLFDTFGVHTVAMLNQAERASIIEALRQLPDVADEQAA